MNNQTVYDYVTLPFTDGTADGNELKWDIPATAYMTNTKGLLCKVSISDAAFYDTTETDNVSICYDGVLNNYSTTTEMTGVLGSFNRNYADNLQYIQYGKLPSQTNHEVTFTFDVEFDEAPLVFYSSNALNEGAIVWLEKVKTITTTQFTGKKVFFSSTTNSPGINFADNNSSPANWIAIGKLANQNIGHKFVKKNIEYLVPARPNQIRLKFFRQNNTTKTGVNNGYVTLKFEYLDPEEVKQNDINQSYKSAFPNK